MIEAALFEILSGDTAIRSLCAKRIYPLVAPPGATYPNITYQLRGTDPNWTLHGPSGLTKKRYQVDCYARSDDLPHRQAHALAEFVRLALLSVRRKNYGGHHVQSAKVEDLFDNWEPITAGSEGIIARVTLLVGIWHAEAVPA